MKHHLHKLPTKPSNWKVHVYSTCWEIVDWNGEVFTKNKALIPKECGGCCVYTTKAPMLTDGTSASCVKIESNNNLQLITMGLKPSAWRISGIGQCDEILFPSTDANGDAFCWSKRNIVRIRIHGKIIKIMHSNRLLIQ